MKPLSSITAKAQKSLNTADTAKARYKLHDFDALYRELCGRTAFEVKRRGMEPDMPSIEDSCRRLATWLTNPEAKQSLVMTGFPGTGKTTLLRAIIGYMREAQWPSCKWYDATDLPTVRLDHELEWTDTILGGNWASYVMLDDVGEEPVTVMEYGRVWPLFQKIVAARYEKMLPFIITTNLNAADLATRYGERTADRLREVADIMTFNNASYRK